jgi:hypothetical protein
MVSGGVSKFEKARPDATFQKMVKEAFDYAMGDVPRLKASFTIFWNVASGRAFSNLLTPPDTM